MQILMQSDIFAFYLKAPVCNFYQNFNIHTLRCDFLYIHDELKITIFLWKGSLIQN